MTTEAAVALITDHIENNITHPDYKRVTTLAADYRAFITGVGINKKLRRYNRREEEEAFKQREALTIAITPAVCHSAINPFAKVTRNRRVVKRLEYDNGNDRAKAVVENMISTFYGDESNDESGVDYWLRTRFARLSFLDPNAFLVVEFDPYDYRYQHPQPRPFEVPCENAINFLYRGTALQWLLVRQEIKWKEKPTDTGKKGYRYTLYDSDYTITADRVATNYAAGPGEMLLKLKGGKEVYLVRVFEPKIGYCAALRVGYLQDDETDGRTFVSPLHPAIGYLEKTLQSVSELDLTILNHVFPQKLQYIDKCKGVGEKQCYGGYDMAGEVCGACNGTGSKLHKSAQDALLLPLPDDKTELFPLRDLIAYMAPPIDLVKFQVEYIDRLEVKCHRTIFNSDVFVQPGNSVAKTATEKENEMESVYDAISPFAARISSFYVFLVWTFSVLADADPTTATIQHTFPQDLKLETFGMLLEKSKTASDSNAPSFVRDGINNDLAAQMYVDDPVALKRYTTQQRFFPFGGKSPEEISTLLNSEWVTEAAKILYANFESVFATLEETHGPIFYEWTYAKQKPEVDAAVLVIQNALKEASADNLNAGLRSLLPARTDADPVEA